jgi:hypothetical protein
LGPSYFRFVKFSCPVTRLIHAWGNINFAPRLYQSQYQVHTCFISAKNQPLLLLVGKSWYGSLEKPPILVVPS